MEVDNPYLKELDGMLTRYIVSIAKLVTDQSRERMKKKKAPIDIDQLPVFMCIFLMGELTQQEIAVLINRDKSSVKRTIALLQKKGLIVVSPHLTDKRKTIVSTTDTGNFVAEQVRKEMRNTESSLFSFLDKKEKSKLLATLKSVYGNLLSSAH